MKTTALMVCIALLNPHLLSAQEAEQEQVFSGPQVGEKLPALSALGVFDGQRDRLVDLVKSDASEPTLLIFFHKRTRPAFGLTNTLMKFAKSRKGLNEAVIFLTDDTTETASWLRRVRGNLPGEITYTISSDGAEGPGAYGLNRNVTVTILVAKEGKVTANYALVQPSLQADGPKILKSIVDVTGGGKVPSIAELAGGRYGDAPARGRMANDPRFTALLRAVINKEASESEVKQAADKVEAYVKENKRAQQELGRITNTVVHSDRFASYGTEAAREYLKKWAKQYPAPRRPNVDRPQTDRPQTDRSKSDGAKSDDATSDGAKPDGNDQRS